MNNEVSLQCQFVNGSKEESGKALVDFREQGYSARLIDCAFLQSERAIFATFAAALQFPWYFGHNWHAFDESIGDLADEDLGNGLGLVFMNAELLDPAKPSFKSLWQSLLYLREDWAKFKDGPALAVVVQYDGEMSADELTAWARAQVNLGDSWG